MASLTKHCCHEGVVKIQGVFSVIFEERDDLRKRKLISY